MRFGFLIDLAVGGAKNAVHELRGIIGAKGFGELNSFVDGDLGRDSVGALAEFVESDAEDVAVNRGDGRERPLRGERLEQIVQRLETRGDVAGEIVDKLSITQRLGVGLNVLRNDCINLGGGVTGFLAKLVFVETL